MGSRRLPASTHLGTACTSSEHWPCPLATNPPYSSATATSSGASSSRAPRFNTPDRPFRSSVVGPALAIPVPGVHPRPSCPGNPTHCSFECPTRYAARSSLPWFQQTGSEDSIGQAGNDFAAQTKADWVPYIGRSTTACPPPTRLEVSP